MAAGTTPAGDANDDSQMNWPGCFRHVARCRRLNKEEVVLILSDPLKFGLVRTEVLPSEGISSGTVYLCSKERVRVLKHDGIDYVKRNAAQGSNRIREDVVKMKVNGRHAVNSYSSRGSGSACFWRRRYALEPPAPSNGSAAGGSRGRGGQQSVAWGDQLVHYLDDEEARGFARRSPFGAAGVARPLTSEDCWRGRGAQLPADGNLFLPVPRRDGSASSAAAAAASRRLEEQHHHATLAAAAAAAANAAGMRSSHSQQHRQSQQGHGPAISLPSPASASEKPLSSHVSVKQEDASSYRGGGSGGGNWSSGSMAGGGSGSKIPSSASQRRYNGGSEVRGSAWGAQTDIYGMAGNGHSHMAEHPAIMGAPAPGRVGGGGGGGGSFLMQPAQQAAALPNPTGFYDDDMSGLEFEGLGMGEVGPGTNGSTDDDMSDLFRSFLVDGEDLLPVGSHSTGSSGHHSGSGGGPPAGFGLRVGGGGGGGGHRGGVGHDAEAAATAAMRRRTSASPDMDEMGGGGGGGSQGLRLMDVPFRPISPQSHSQRSPMVMLPALVGSPPRRSDSHNSNSNSNNSNSNNNNNSNENKNTGGGINAPASRFVPSNHGHGNSGGSSSSGSGSNNHAHGHSSAKVSAAAVAAAAAAVTAAGAETCVPPASLQLASPWAVESYSSASSMTNNVSSSSPAGGAHDIAGGVPAAPSPAGMSGGGRGIGGGGATIVDFSPTWDFSPGGAKLLICLASPIDVDPGGTGPLVFFADRPVQAEVVSPNVLRCRVPPGPGPDCVGRVTLRVENSQSHGGGGIGRLESPATSHGGSRNDVGNQGILGVHVFEYRAPTNSPSSTPSNISRGGTPVASTPNKKRSWQELPTSESSSAAARKREWGEVTTSSAPSPLEPIYSSPVVGNWAERGRAWGTPRAGEPTPWVGSTGKGCRGSQSASGARRGQPHPWRRASGDFGQMALAATTRPNEDSLGYPSMPCDGRECKIRIVERLGEIQGSRRSSVTSDMQTDSVRGSFTSPSGGGDGSGVNSAGGNTANDKDSIDPSTAGASESGTASTVFMGGLGGAAGSTGGTDLSHHQALDDTALNELGDAELEVLLEQMWMKVMGQLTDLESELNALDTRGLSVLHYTCLHSLSALVPVLLERGADVNLRTGDGHNQTPLHLAATAGSLSIVQELVKKGANLNALDAYGLTPDKLAMRGNKREVGVFLWNQVRGTIAGGTSTAPASSASPSSTTTTNNGTTTATTATTTTTMRQDSPAPVLPWGGGVSPAGCPPSPWSGSTGGGGGPDNWVGQLSPSPETANEHTPPSSSTTHPSSSPPHPSTTRSQSHAGESGSAASAAVSTAGGATSAAGTAAPGIAGLDGNGGGDADGEWGIGLPPPGGGRTSTGGGSHGRVDIDAPPSLDRLEMSPMEEVGNGENGGGQGSSESEGSGRKSASTEQLLAEAFSTLSLHEKCALSLHVSSLQRGRQQQGAFNGADAQSTGIDFSELSNMSKVLSGEEGGLPAHDLRAIMSMMGPSDLSDVEDEVKIIQQNVRAWILRCNYKSLRKAARTLQVAWRERQKNRLAEVDASTANDSTPGGGSNRSPLNGHPPSPAQSLASVPSNLALNSGGGSGAGTGPDPMDDGTNEHVYGSNVGDVSGGETPTRTSDAGLSDAGGGGGSGAVGLKLGGAASERERAAREERAANALQAAARVMLARRGRFQRLARETSALLVIQKRSREWLKQKQNL